MSAPSGDQPTRVLPSTAEQPPATTAPPPPATFWRQRVPAHIGRARTSTVVLAVLFVAFAVLYGLVRPAVEYTTITTETGESYRVPVDQIAPATEPTEPAAPTTAVPEGTEPGEPAGTTEPETTTSQRTPPAPTTTDEEEPTASTTSPESTTTRAPATTEESAPPTEPEETPTPTS